jgi:peptidoglycan/LPS O-acetylase OafA/YrhL
VARVPDRRIPGIDVLRGLAVIFVVIHHAHLRFALNHYPVAGLLPEMLDRVLFRSGYYSVLTFFVISGFLITSLSLRRWGSLERIPLAMFYRMRAARILPCLLLLLAILSVLHLVGAPDYTINPERATLPRTLLAAFTFHINWLEGHRGYLPGNWDVLWSLSVEEVFYILFPLACVLLRRAGWVLLLLVALLIVGPFNRVALAGQEPWDDYAYFSCADGLAYGCLAAWISTRVRFSRTALRTLLGVGLAAVVLIGVFRKLTFALGLTKVGLNASVLEFGVALMLMAFAGGVGNSALSWGTGWLRQIGQCSYEIYLTHMFAVMTLLRVFEWWFVPVPASPIVYLVALAVMLGVSVLLGFIVARLFSEPVNAALRGTTPLRFRLPGTTGAS